MQTLLEGLAARADTLTTKYGNVTKASVGSIQRSLLVLDRQGGAHFFGKPVLNIKDLMLKDGGRGYISVLAAEKLMELPRLYATFLLFLLSELFEVMPEVGDPEKPNLVFFFDEAHLLFKDAPKALLEKVEQVVRLIRSKGVGVYFVTQNPLDIPDTVSRQLGNRVQHALRAFSPLEQKAVKAAATTFRANPAFDTEKAIMELGTGEALVSTLDEKGQPSIVQRTLVRPPNSRVGPITDSERNKVIAASPVEYPEKPADSDSEQARLQQWADGARGRQSRQCRREGDHEDELGRCLAQRQFLDDARQDHHQDRRAIGDESADGCSQGQGPTRRRLHRLRRARYRRRLEECRSVKDRDIGRGRVCPVQEHSRRARNPWRSQAVVVQLHQLRPIRT